MTDPVTPTSSSVKPAPKKGLPLGCLIGLGVLALLALGCFVGTVVFLKSDVGAAMVEVVDQARAGASAPGTTELKAAGCAVAIVIDEADMEATFNKHFDAGLDPAGHVMNVLCNVTRSEGPDCAALAKVYVTAIGGTAAGPVKVEVHGPGNTTLCSKRFTAVGEPE